MPQPPLPELDGVRHFDAELPTGVRLHVAEAGPADAPQVLLLHGWPQHWWCWRRVVEHLQGDFRLLMPDLRGLGWSGMPDDGDYRKQRLADDAVALLDQLGLERAGLVGHDWGGWAAYLAAAGSPERFSGLLALGIAHPWAPLTTAARELYRLAYQVPIATPVLGPRLVRDTPLVALAHRTWWGERSTFDAAAVERYAAAYRDPRRADASSRLYRSFVLREVPARAVPPRLRIPARAIAGDRDPLGLRLLAAPGGPPTDVLAGCGHFVPEERPAEVAAAARALFGG